VIIVRRYWVPALGVLFVVGGVTIMRVTPRSYVETSFVRNPPEPFWLAVAWFSQQWLVYFGLVLVAGWVGYRLALRRSKRVSQ
jgi:hypothetical protein